MLNNIAWMLRRFPVHPIAGSGDYRVQPISVDDLADVAVRLSRESGNVEIDAVGPDVFTYREMVQLVKDKIGASSRLVSVSRSAALLAARLMGLLVRDVVLTRDEIDGLTADLLVSKSGEPPPGTTRLSEWLDDNASLLGSEYASEMQRHYK